MMWYSGGSGRSAVSRAVSALVAIVWSSSIALLSSPSAGVILLLGQMTRGVGANPDGYCVKQPWPRCDGLRQVFTEATGSANPFANITLGRHPSAAFADLNNDGHLDLVTASLGPGHEKIKVWYNSGSSDNTWPAEADLTTSPPNPFEGKNPGDRLLSVTFADLDGNGFLDLVVGDFYDKLRVFFNDGTNAWTEATGASNPFSHINAGQFVNPRLADINGDGHLDLALGTGDGNIRVWYNSGTNTWPTESLGRDNPFKSIDVGNSASPNLVDLNGDGFLDLVSGRQETGDIYVWFNDGTNAWPTRATGAANPFDTIFDLSMTQSSGLGKGYSNPVFVDLNNDGKLDMVMGMGGDPGTGHFRVWYNSVASTWPDEATGLANPFAGFTEGSHKAPAFADLNGDGYVDFVYGDYDGKLRAYMNDGNNVYTKAFAQNPFTAGMALRDFGADAKPTFVDVVGDSRRDLVLGTRGAEISGQGIRFRVFENDGSDEWPEAIGAANPFPCPGVECVDPNGVDWKTWGSATPAFVDIDDDGDLDYVFGNYAGECLVVFTSRPLYLIVPTHVLTHHLLSRLR